MTDTFAVTQMKMEAMTITPKPRDYWADDSDTEWDDSNVVAVPIGSFVPLPAPIPTLISEQLFDFPKPQVSAPRVKNEAIKLERQNWTMFVRAICEKRPKTFIVKSDDAHSSAWAVKTLNTAEYYFWSKAFRVYKDNKNLALPQKQGIKAIVDKKEGERLNKIFVSLFPGEGFWMSNGDWRSNEIEAVQTFGACGIPDQ